MKKISLIVCIVLIVATLTAVFVGCNGNSNDPNQITVWWPSGKAMQDIIENAVKDFTATHPEAKINIVNKPVDAFEAYKYALNDNKTRPDVAIVDHVYIAALANDKQLADLTALGCDDVKSLYPQNVFEACTYNGQAYGLPFSANTVVLMYNKDILSACGVTVPKTMDELIAACKTVSEKGYIAFAQPQNDFAVMEFVSYAARCGGKVVSDDYKTVTFDNSGVSKAIDKWIALSKYASQSTYEEDKFYNGKVAFVEMGSWALTSVTGSSKRFDCGFAEMVTIDEDTPNYSGLGLYSLCIAEKSATNSLLWNLPSICLPTKPCSWRTTRTKTCSPSPTKLFPTSITRKTTRSRCMRRNCKRLLLAPQRPFGRIWKAHCKICCLKSSVPTATTLQS